MPSMIRRIIKINEDFCTGCGNCIPGCVERALQLVDTPKGKKARLVKEIYCDGLGACIGSCPTGALTIEERESEPFDHAATTEYMQSISQSETNTSPLSPPELSPPPFSGCPGSRAFQWAQEESDTVSTISQPSQLRQWPVQLHLVSPDAPYFKAADLVFIADCVPFAYPNIHQEFLKGRAIIVACPQQLDDHQKSVEKIAQIIKIAQPRNIQVVHMTVACCFGLKLMVEDAMKLSGTDVPLKVTIINMKGELQEVQ